MTSDLLENVQKYEEDQILFRNAVLGDFIYKLVVLSDFNIREFDIRKSEMKGLRNPFYSLSNVLIHTKDVYLFNLGKFKEVILAELNENTHFS